MGATTTRLTFEEFERLPEQPGKRELLRGELIELPPAELKYRQIAQRLFQGLNDALAEAHGRGEASNLGEAFHEMGYKLSDGSWVQPDVSVTHAGQAVGKNLSDSPAIAVEVISPDILAEDLALKIDLHLQWGAREVWLVYPRTRKVVVFTTGVGRVARANQTMTTPLLPAFAMPVAEILGE